MKTRTNRRTFLQLTSRFSAGALALSKAPSFVVGAATGAAVLPASVQAAAHEIQAIVVKFEPVFVYIEPGDRVDWTNMAGHLIETIDTMVPEGTEKYITEMGQNVSKTFDDSGIFVYKCTPHWGARMGGVVVVGKPDDASATIDAYLATLETDKENLPAKGLLKKLRKDMESKGML